MVRISFFLAKSYKALPYASRLKRTHEVVAFKGNSGADLPNVIINDIEMPKMGGSGCVQ